MLGFLVFGRLDERDDFVLGRGIDGRTPEAQEVRVAAEVAVAAVREDQFGRLSRAEAKFEAVVDAAGYAVNAV